MMDPNPPLYKIQIHVRNKNIATACEACTRPSPKGTMQLWVNTKMANYCPVCAVALLEGIALGIQDATS